MSFAEAERIADAVLYEGYALYPYRASSTKNRVRWQFGVVIPRDFAEQGETDPWFVQTECPIERAPDAADTDVTVDVRVRALQVQSRTIERMDPAGGWQRVASARTGGEDLIEWEEAVERTFDVSGLSLHALTLSPIDQRLDVPANRSEEPRTDDEGCAVRIGRETAAMTLQLSIDAREQSRLTTLRVRVVNVTPLAAASERTIALRHALVGAHILLSVRNGRFISLLDPPEHTASAAAACVNHKVWPVLVGNRELNDLMLASPIILYDYPAVAPESPGNLFDATEIDEILTLRIMTLTDAEKAEARATDPRARGIIDRTDALSPEALGRLHGEMRPTAAPHMTEDESAWRALLNPEGASPEIAIANVGGVPVTRGSRVVLRPSRRADPMDMFLTGRTALVQGVYRDLEGRGYVSVVLDDDPAGELHAELGRFFYYGIDEIEPEVVNGRSR
jgi:hypothetical protein